jgi:class 3 adenylate cyclase
MLNSNPAVLRERRVERRVTAILAADVVGYSRLMESDELRTFGRLKQLREQLVNPTVASSGGRVVELTGDGFLAEFASAACGALSNWSRRGFPNVLASIPSATFRCLPNEPRWCRRSIAQLRIAGSFEPWRRVGHADEVIE